MTTQNSTQYANEVASPPVILESNISYGKMRVLKYNFTQSGVGSAGSVARLRKLPPGKLVLLAGQSQCKISDLGSGRTLHLGWSAYLDRITGATVSADVDGITVSQAGNVPVAFTPGAALADGTKLFDSRAGVTLIATCNVGTIPDTATIQGTWVIAVE